MSAEKTGNNSNAPLDREMEARLNALAASERAAAPSSLETVAHALSAAELATDAELASISAAVDALAAFGEAAPEGLEDRVLASSLASLGPAKAPAQTHGASGRTPGAAPHRRPARVWWRSRSVGLAFAACLTVAAGLAWLGVDRANRQAAQSELARAQEARLLAAQVDSSIDQMWESFSLTTDPSGESATDTSKSYDPDALDQFLRGEEVSS